MIFLNFSHIIILYTCWQAAGMRGRRTGTRKRGGGRTSTGGFALGTTSAGKHLKSHETAAGRSHFPSNT